MCAFRKIYTYIFGQSVCDRGKRGGFEECDGMVGQSIKYVCMHSAQHTFSAYSVNIISI